MWLICGHVANRKWTNGFHVDNVNTMKVNTRQDKTKYCNVVAKKNRYKTSPISYLTSLLNQNK